ncbi:hypothetical protein V2H45_15625 [Tumidithrix elongata RA019]|uniref:Uncharacterized protein n=1 Tax=Tumidithrix elongata BACA0141 TaxID=2716417 RepID=A0AAW9Q4J8_9CYAN|nr:hypothetical protein [Tumidithrix elongata RA019]
MVDSIIPFCTKSTTLNGDRAKLFIRYLPSDRAEIDRSGHEFLRVCQMLMTELAKAVWAFGVV